MELWTSNGSGAVIMILVAGPSGPSGRITVKGLTLSDIAAKLTQQLRPEIDRTWLTGKYDFVLEYTPDLPGLPLPALPQPLRLPAIRARVFLPLSKSSPVSS